MEGLGEFLEVPLAYVRLRLELVSADLQISVIANEVWVVVLHHHEWAVVEGQPQDAHIVSI